MHRTAAADPIQPLAWERPYVAGPAVKRGKKKRKSTQIKDLNLLFPHLGMLGEGPDYTHCLAVVSLLMFQVKQIHVQHLKG